MTAKELVELLLSGVDRSRPDGVNEKGRYWNLRCKVPVAFQFDSRVKTIVGDEAKISSRAKDSSGNEIELSEDENEIAVIEGPASSTGQDWYGTRMTKGCLEDMAVQFKAGVSYLPRHHSWMQTVEWYEQIGKTIGAELIKAEVKNPPEGESATDQYILNVSTELWLGEPVARTLVRRVKSGNPPSQSIGAWFREVQVTYDDDGYVVYPINVLRVELDHLAAVRSPGNDDADEVWLVLEKKFEEFGASLRSSVVSKNSAENAEELPSKLPNIPSSTEQLGARSIGSSSGLDAPPVEDHTPSGRNSEETMTEEQLRALMEGFQRSIETALNPIREEVQNLRSSMPAPKTPEQRAEEAEQRALAAEQRLAALEARQRGQDIIDSAAPRSGQRSDGGRAPADSANPPVPELFRGPDNRSDMREFAPMACRAAARTGGEIDVSPALVLQYDGLKALATYAKLQKTGVQLAQFALDVEDLGERNVHSRAGKLRCRSSDELKDLLAEVCYRGVLDGTIASKNQTSWSG